MYIGRVKWYDNEKGYGFISYKDEEDIFIHKSALENSLEKGQFVKFKIVNTIKGFQAIDVKIVTDLTLYDQNNIFKK